MAFRLERLHDLQGGESVVRGVAQLRGTEFAIRPVTGGDRFGFFEALLEQNSNRSTDAYLSPVALLAEDLIEIEHVVEGDSQSAPNLSVIVLQPEAHFEDLLGGDEIGDDFHTLTPMKLENVGFVGERELHHVGAVAFLSYPEGRFGFGIKSTKTCGENFVGRVLALGPGPGHVDLIGGKSLEGG